MKRVKMVVAYDGTNYQGWQLQPNGTTIEEILNRQLSALLGEKIVVTGASRTDSGVHAMGNVAIFDTSHRMPADKICFALNQGLPEDIRIQRSEEVSPDWHPRKCNCTKIYEYKILNCKVDMPLTRLYAHFCYYPLDVALMQQAAAYLIGEHDFKSFCTTRTQSQETVRTIYQLLVTRQDDLITIRISGSGFLYNMVRIIAGTLMEAGMGTYPPEHLETILNARDRNAAGRTASAKGLTLIGMEYETRLPQWHSGENREWKYTVLQSHIKLEQAAYFLVERCRDEEWEGLLRRTIHHEFRNGAQKVYLVDLADDRLKAEDIYGYYRITAMTPMDLDKAMECLTPEERTVFKGICGRIKKDAAGNLNWYCAVIDKNR